MICHIGLLLIPWLLYFGLRVYLAGVMLITFILFGADKYLALHGKRRIPEKVLILWSLWGGAWAGMAAMVLFHHKTAKTSVWLPVTLIAGLQLVAAGVLICMTCGQ